MGQKTGGGRGINQITDAPLRHFAGYGAGSKLPLEVLAMAAPDTVITARAYPGASRSEEVMDHPAVQAFRAPGSAAMSDQDWVCGTPFVLRAIETLGAARRQITGAAD